MVSEEGSGAKTYPKFSVLLRPTDAPEHHMYVSMNDWKKDSSRSVRVYTVYMCGDAVRPFDDPSSVFLLSVVSELTTLDAILTASILRKNNFDREESPKTPPN